MSEVQFGLFFAVIIAIFSNALGKDNDRVISPRVRKYGFHVYNFAPEMLLDYASAHKLNHIEISLTREHAPLESFDRERIATLNAFAAQNQIEWSLHLPHAVNLADIIPPMQWRHLNYFIKAIHLAYELHATHITTHIGNFFWFPVTHWSRRKALGRFLDNMQKIIALCEAKGIVIAIENLVPIPHGTDFYLLGDNIEDFIHIFAVIDSPALRFCLDTGHANMAEGVLAYLARLGDKLACIHYHDNRGFNDEHLPVGQGTIPWREMVAELTRMDYAGPYVSECRNIHPHEAAELLQAYFNDTLIMPLGRP